MIYRKVKIANTYTQREREGGRRGHLRQRISNHEN